jgi:mannose-6-phosphate isomerase-like protein (cupin superfamily)
MPATAPLPWLHNPVTGEIARVNVAADASGGRQLDVDLWLQPGAAVARAHVHDHFVERFTVVAGELGVQVGADERSVPAGAPTLEVPAGTVHDWWNGGDDVAQVHVEVAATATAPGRPAERFVAMIEALWSLGALGLVNAKGVADPLWMAAIAREFRDVIRFTSPPSVVQAMLLGSLAAIARRTDRDPLAGRLHGPTAPCAIVDPGDDGLAELLSRPVGTRAARRGR